MAFKCMILLAVLAVANAGYLGSPVASYAAPAVAYAAPAYAHGAYAAPAYAHGAYAAPAYAHGAYAAPALAARAYAAPAGLLGVAYSAAPVVSHMTYSNAYGTHYTY